MAIWKGSHTPRSSPWLLTTYKSWDDPPRVTGGVVEAPRNGACLKGKEPFDRVLVEKFETEVENLETLEMTGLFSLCSGLYCQICRGFLISSRWWQLTCFLFSLPIPGEMIQFHEHIFQMG